MTRDRARQITTPISLQGPGPDEQGDPQWGIALFVRMIRLATTAIPGFP